MHASVLKYFVEVARCGSIRKAAQNLYVASSAVNRQILKLEAEMGTDLFDRLPNGIRLNAAGERMLQHIRATLNDFHLMRGELDELKDERTGHVSVAAMDSLFVDLLPAAVESSRDNTRRDVCHHRRHALGCGVQGAQRRVRRGHHLHFKLPAGLDVMTQVALPPGVVMASSHPLARKDVVSFADCRSHAFLRLEGRFPMQGGVSPKFSEFWDLLTPA